MSSATDQLTRERLREVIELLESIAADRSVLAGVPDDFGREHRLVGDDQSVGRRPGNVGGGDDREHAVEGERRCGVDAAETRMRMR